MLSRVAEFFGAQNVHVGSRDFDEQFTVKTDNEVQAVRLLTDKVQQLLSELVNWAGTVRDRSAIGSDSITIHLADQSLRIELTGFLTTCNELIEYVERVKRLVDLIDSR